MSLYCTVANLVSELGEKKVAELARDDGSTAVVTSDATVQSRLTYYITDASNSIRSLLYGRADVDAVVAGSQLADDLRRWCVIIVLDRLYRRRGHWTEQMNPYMAEKKLAIEEIRTVAKGEAKIGEPGAPSNEAWSSSQDDSPTYGKAAVGGAGTDSSLLEGF